MARLIGVGPGPTTRTISIQPILFDGGDSIEYEVELDVTPNGIHFKQRYSVKGWQQEHEEIWIVAKTFIEAANLIDVKVPVCIYGRSQERASVRQYVGWLEVIISDTHNKRSKAFTIEAFFEVGPDTFLRYAMRAAPEAVVQFGKDLEAEIALAAPKYWRGNHAEPCGEIGNSSSGSPEEVS
jgi:hypothetical protein